MRRKEDRKTLVNATPEPALTPGASERAVLVMIYPPGAGLGRRFELGAAEVVLGRAAACDISIDHDAVAERHASIVREGAGWRVVDRGSGRGIVVNDRLAREHALQDGDLVRIGDRVFKFLDGSNVEALYHEELYRMATTDELTRTYNRQYILESIERALSRRDLAERPLALVLLGVDHLRRINEQHGQRAGDQVLVALAQQVQSRLGPGELLGRHDSDQFIVLKPEAGRGAALELAEELRASAREWSVPHEDEAVRFTISAGVVTSDEGRSFDRLLQLAHERLRSAKQSGRDRVVGVDAPPPDAQDDAARKWWRFWR